MFGSPFSFCLSKHFNCSYNSGESNVRVKKNRFQGSRAYRKRNAYESSTVHGEGCCFLGDHRSTEATIAAKEISKFKKSKIEELEELRLCSRMSRK